MNRFVILFLALALPVLAAEPALKVSLLDNAVMCIRVSQVPTNFAEQLQAVQPTNKISGTILDLRFAGGDRAVSTGNIFAGQKSPLVILVNDQTRDGAAELVTQLRANGRGIVIGGTNGSIKPDITVAVSSADERKFQTDPFAQIVPEKGVSMAATNDLLPFVDHMSEAELVSKRAKDGELDEPDMPRAEPLQPVISDPALARAVDLLKALAILHKTRG